MKYDLQRLYEWPRTPRLTASALICFVIFYMGYFFDISHLRKQLTRAYQQEQDTKVQLAALIEEQAKIRYELNKHPALIQTVDQLKKQIISPRELPVILDKLIKTAKQSDLELLNFTPGKETKLNSYTIVEINLTAMGTYDQIANFISQIANLSQLVAINDIGIAKLNTNKTQSLNNNLLQADINLDLYEVTPP